MFYQLVRHRIDGLEIAPRTVKHGNKVRHRIDGLEKDEKVNF